MKSEELKLKDKEQVAAVIKNHALLDSMRYVEVKVSIKSERLKVTTITSPILLLFELLGLFKLIQLLLGAFSKTRLPKFEEPIKFKKINWKKVWYNFLTLVFLIFLIISIILGFSYIPLILMVLMVLAIAIAWFLILRKLNLIPKITITWRKFWDFIKNIFRSIYRFFQNLYYWWQSRTLCQKILLIHFILDAIIIIAVWMNWIIICRSFWW